MKKTSLFLYGNSRTDKCGRRREESGRKSREGTTDVGETGLDSCDVKGGTRSGGGGWYGVFCYKELRSRENETK
jgi:hypothetical protein